jgi:hypothetical protein
VQVAHASFSTSVIEMSDRKFDVDDHRKGPNLIKNLDFLSSLLKSDGTTEKKYCYKNTLVIGKEKIGDDKTGYVGWVIQYGVCSDGEYNISEGYYFLPREGENAETVLYRCKREGVDLDTSNITSVYYPAPFGHVIKMLKKRMGYPYSKLLTVGDMLGKESMLKDVIYGKYVTYGKVIGLLTDYSTDHSSELGMNGIISSDYNISAGRIVSNFYETVFDAGIDISRKFKHFNICKHDVSRKQSERINDALPVFEDTERYRYLSTLHLLKAFTLFDSTYRDKPLISEDDRIRYQTIIDQYYKDVLRMVQDLDIDIKSVEDDIAKKSQSMGI